MKPFSVRHQLALIKMVAKYSYQSRYYWIKNAKGHIDKLSMSDDEKRSLFQSFCRDYNKYRQKWHEYYFEYHFPELTDRQKKEYLTIRDLYFILKNTICFIRINGI